MTRIRIKKTPRGIPKGKDFLWVRKEWIGLEFIIAENVPSDTQPIGMKNKVLRDSNSGYWVGIGEAFVALGTKSPKTLRWWVENGSKLPGGYKFFLFKKSCCEVVI